MTTKFDTSISWPNMARSVGGEYSSVASGGVGSRLSAGARGDFVRGVFSSAVPSAISTRELRNGVIVIEGSGANMLALGGADGFVLVDTGIAESEDGIKLALGALDDRPINHAVNTHWHFDHVDGNSWLGRDGAEIYAHRNTWERLGKPQRVDDWDYDFPAVPTEALPSQLVRDGQVLRLNGENIELEFYGPSHTDSDISVRFAKADILHTGDTYWNRSYPFIDYSTGGSIDGMINAADLNLQMASPSTIVVAGHGDPISDRKGLREFREMLVSVRDCVANLKMIGLDLDETLDRRPTRDFDETWGKSSIAPALFVKLVYDGI